jgi:hypothetical protein
MTELRPDTTKVHTLNQPECKEVVDKMEAILQAGPPAALADGSLPGKRLMREKNNET